MFNNQTLKNLEHLKPFAGKGPHVCLEIGVGDGEMACWLLDNVLTCMDDLYVGIDPWDGKDGPEKEDKARRAMGRYSGKGILFKGEPKGPGWANLEDHPRVSRGVGFGSGTDFDGERWRFLFTIAVFSRCPPMSSLRVLQCAVWDRMPVGGVILWDNYRTTKRKKHLECCGTVGEFLARKEGKYKILCQNTHLIIKKTAE